MTRVLLVEDDAHLRYGLAFNLSREGWEVLEADCAEDGEQLWRGERPDLVLLDIMLPGMSGLELLERLRGEDRRTPVMVLTARSDESDAVCALSLGADDYVRKPFGVGELVARMRSLLRRVEKISPVGPRRLGAWRLDFENLRAFHVDGHDVPLTALEVEVLRLFADRPGEVLKREDLLSRVWGVDSKTPTRTLDNHIARLRKKLEADPTDPRLIITVHGVGYKSTG